MRCAVLHTSFLADLWQVKLETFTMGLSYAARVDLIALKGASNVQETPLPNSGKTLNIGLRIFLVDKEMVGVGWFSKELLSSSLL